MDKKDVSILPLFGIPFISNKKKQVIDFLSAQIEKNPQKRVVVVCTPNPEQVAASFHNPKFKRDLLAADWLLPDGQGVVWALNRLYHQDVERIPGRIVFHELLAEAKL